MQRIRPVLTASPHAASARSTGDFVLAGSLVAVALESWLLAAGAGGFLGTSADAAVGAAAAAWGRGDGCHCGW